MSTTEKLLFKLLANAVLEMKGGIECDNKYLRRLEDDGIKYQMNLGGSGEKLYATADACLDAFLDEIQKRKKSLNSVVFYPSWHEDIGTTWRFLKIDMSFLRIVLSGDSSVLSDIVKRIALIVFAGEDKEAKDQAERN